MAFSTMNSKTITKNLSYFVMLASFVILIVTIVVSHGESLSQLFFFDKTDTGMDFYNSMYSAGTYRPYERGDIYPPLAELFFVVCSRFCPSSIWDSPFAIPEIRASQIRVSQGGQIAFILFILISVSLLILSVKKIAEKTRDFHMLFICFLVSMPFLYCVERGNILLLVFSCTAFFIAYYDDESVAKREVALVMLAVASALKIYPAIFVILLFHEKKVIPVIRVGAYTAALSLLPFIFLGGGGTLIKFIQNCSSFAGSASDKVITLNSSGVFTAIEIFSGVELYGADFILGSVLVALLLLLSFFVHEKWKRVLLITLALLNGFPVSFMYMGVFLLLPWALFVFTEKKGIDSAVYTIFFLIVLTPLPMGQADKAISYISAYGETKYIPLSYKSIVSAFAVTALSIFIVFDVLRSIIHKRMAGKGIAIS